MYDVYTALAMQPEVWVCRTREDVKKNLDRYVEILGSRAVWAYAQFSVPRGLYPPDQGPWAPLKLVALPEMALNLPAAITDEPPDVQELIENVCIRIPGPETEALGRVCRKQGFYLACGAYEFHEAFSGRIFNSAFLLDPQGEVILVHRKYNNWIPFEWPATSPHDVFDQYREVFGKAKSLIETFFPVIDTDIGRIGMLTCNDGMYPENWRALGLQGAEVILHGNLPEPYASSPTDWRALVARTNAMYNMCYVVAPSWGAKRNSPMPVYSTGGQNGSMIVDPEGRILSQIGYPGESCTSAVIAVDHVRRRRADPGVWNFLTHIRTEAYREMYSREIYPVNTLAQRPLVGAGDIMRRDVHRLGVVGKLRERGVLHTASTAPGVVVEHDGAGKEAVPR